MRLRSDQRNPSTRRPLTGQQIFRASTLWDENYSLREIAEEVGCSVYQLGFLYRELLANLRRAGVVTPVAEERLPTRAQYAYAICFSDKNGIREGFNAGPFSTLKEALDYECEDECDCNVIVRVGGDSAHIVAAWDNKNACWVRVDKKHERA